MDRELKWKLLFAGLITVGLPLLGLVGAFVIDQVMAPEEAKLAPKQLEDDPEAYQVARGANVGVIKRWMWLGIGVAIGVTWSLTLTNYWRGKEEEEDLAREESHKKGGGI